MSTTRLSSNTPLIIQPTITNSTRTIHTLSLHTMWGHAPISVMKKLIEYYKLDKTLISLSSITKCPYCSLGQFYTKNNVYNEFPFLATAQLGNVLHMDIVFINGTPLLFSLEHVSRYCEYTPISSRKQEDVVIALQYLIDKWKLRLGEQFIKFIITDDDSSFRSNFTINYLNTVGIKLFTSPTGYHQFYAENATRWQRKLFRMIYYQIGLKFTLPQHLYIYLLHDCALLQNLRPLSTTGIPPFTLINNYDFNLDALNTSFGDIVSCHQEADTSLDARTCSYGFVIGTYVNALPGSILVYIPLTGSTRTVGPKFYHHVEWSLLTKEDQSLFINLNKKQHSPTNGILGYANQAGVVTDMKSPTNDPPTNDPPLKIENPPLLPTATNSTTNKSNGSTKMGVPTSMSSPPPTTINPTTTTTKIKLIKSSKPQPTQTIKPTKPTQTSSGRTIKPLSFGDAYVTSVSTNKPTNHEESDLVELQSLIDKEVFVPVHHSNHHTITKLKMIQTIKYTQDGELDKFKSRLVFQHHQDYEYVLTDFYASTLQICSLILILNIAAYFNAIITSQDIRTAFLTTLLPPNSQIYVRFSKIIAALLMKLNPEKYKSYIQPDGTLVGRLLRSLYGLREASSLFYTFMYNIFISLGYETCFHDKCLFMKRIGNKFLIIGLVTDDIISITTSPELQQELTNALIKHFGIDGFTTSSPQDKFIFFRQLCIQKPVNGTIWITQQKLIEDILSSESTKLVGDITADMTATIPTTQDLFFSAQALLMDHPNTISDNDIHHLIGDLVPLNEWLSIVMKIFYLARNTRPDLLLTCHVLAAATIITKHHLKLLKKLLCYLNCTKDLPLQLHPTSLQLIGFSDAALAVYGDKSSQLSANITIGGSFVTMEVKKSKYVFDNICEGEAVACKKASKMIMHFGYIMNQLGFHQQYPLQVMVDNTSTIQILTNGNITKNTRHWNATYQFWVYSRIREKQIVLIHVTSADNIADCGTKHLETSTFNNLISKILHPYPTHKYPILSNTI